MKANESVNDSLNALVIKPSGIQPASLANVLTLTKESADYRKHIFFNAQTPIQNSREGWSVGAQVHYSKNGLYRPKKKQIIAPFYGLNEKQKDQIMYAVRDDYLRGLIYHGRIDKLPEILKATGAYNEEKYLHWCIPKLVTTKSVLVPQEPKQKENPIKQYARMSDYLSINVDHYQPKILEDKYWEPMKRIAKECGLRNIQPCQFSAVLKPVDIIQGHVLPGEEIAEYFKHNYFIGNYTKERTMPEDLAFEGIRECFNIRMHTPEGSMQLFYMGGKEMVEFCRQAEAEFILPYHMKDDRLDEAEYTLSKKIPSSDPTHYSKLDLNKLSVLEKHKYAIGPDYIELIRDPRPKADKTVKAIFNGSTYLGLN